MEAVVYQCPNCGAPLEFNSETQRWDCKFCLSSFEKEQLEQMTDEQKKRRKKSSRSSRQADRCATTVLTAARS